MPFYRVLDLAILICQVRKIFMEHCHKSEKSYPNYPVLDRIGLQGVAINVKVCIDNEQIETDMNIFDDCLHRDDEIIS